MSEHYYSKKPSADSRPEKITEAILGEEFRFTVDRGVFSRAGLDYGSRLLIETFESPEADGMFADAGCGWGPIGIALAKFHTDRKILMVDVNERAVELAKLNATVNKVSDRVEVFQNDLLTGQTDKGFAAILTNPPIRAGKEVVFQLYEQAFLSLVQGGELWVVIQKKQGAPSTQKKLEELGLKVEVSKKSRGYFILRGKKC